MRLTKIAKDGMKRVRTERVKPRVTQIRVQTRNIRGALIIPTIAMGVFVLPNLAVPEKNAELIT